MIMPNEIPWLTKEFCKNSQNELLQECGKNGFMTLNEWRRFLNETLSLDIPLTIGGDLTGYVIK